MQYFTQEQVISIINSESNLKYKLLFMLIYSAGLRVSEAVSLRKENINTENMFIEVSYKGKKRNTILSKKVAELFKEYCLKYKLNDYVFENKAGKHLSVRQAERVFNKALQKSGVYENISIKNLRDFFAVHLLESGIDISYVQKFLSIKKRSVMKYMFASKMQNVNIKSFIDD